MTNPTPCGQPEMGIAITHPGPGPDGGHCRVTVRAPRRRDSAGREDGADASRYRSYCGGCGHEGPRRESANEAVEDGHDHAFPGWRSMPVVVHRPYTDKPQPLARWKAAVAAAYPAEWLERGGPVRELRHGLGGRHVPGLAPGGGYLMAVLRPEPGVPDGEPAVRLALFE